MRDITNMKMNALVSIIAMTSLAACSDSSTLDSVQPTAQAGLSNDAVSADSGISSSLAGAPDAGAANDLTIGDVGLTGSFSSQSTVSYQFAIAENSGSALPADQLSVALEIAASGSFTDAYRVALFDLRADGGVYSARSAPVDLPGGAYTARLVVNPSWQYAFNIVPADHKHTEPFRYVAEADYSNNASDTFQVQVANSQFCVEDEFEDNDALDSAQPIPVGGQINASLCLDQMDLYSVELADGEETTFSFSYTDTESNQNAATSYVVLDDDLQAIGAPGVAREFSNIAIEATSGGTYHLALFSQRSSYQLTRLAAAGADGSFNDFIDTNLFSSSTIAGPQSWLFGDVTLQKLAITEEKLSNQVVNCGRITTQYSGNEPVAYVTPSHFADINEYRFLAGGIYLFNAEQESGWTISNGDISNPTWYLNEYPGYAERVSDNNWRYWSTDGLAYVDCTLQVN